MSTVKHPRLPANVKCPMCSNKMVQMGVRDTTTDLTMSTLNYSESDKGKAGKKKHFVRTAVYLCEKCLNIQSFLMTNPKEVSTLGQKKTETGDRS